MIPESGRWRLFVARLGGIGADPSDQEEIARAKSLLILSGDLIIVLALVWVVLYWVYDEYLAAAIPAFYIVATLLSQIAFARSRSFPWYRDSQLLLISLLPFALQLALGGFVSASGVVVWSLIAPLGALAFKGPNAARRWFLSFVGLVVTAALFESFVPAGNNIPEELRLGFSVANIVGSALVAYLLLDLFVSQLHLERAKSEGLLLNVLPPSIAARLRREPQRVIADRYEQASVLFADVVGFTPLSASLTPEGLVAVLNEVFSGFDVIAESHGIEKIKTIGDSYMAAAGVPEPRTDHARAVAEMALDILDYCVSHPLPGGVPLRFRIGINSGPLVAGVIGLRKFSYDLWGDTVNTASRMESHGEADLIQLTESVYELLKEEYICEARGVIEVKGKGVMPTWTLVGRR